MVKRYLLVLAKLLAIAGIFVFLIARAIQNDSFTEFMKQDKNWGLLLAAFAATCLGNVLTLIRWRWLVTALGVKLSLNEALRIGFIGLLFNLSIVGIVGGDAVKTYLLGRKQPGTMIASAASVIVDRAIGLYVMFLIAIVMIFATGFVHYEQYEARFAVTAVFALTIAATVCIAILLTPDSRYGFRHRLIRLVPFAGGLLDRLTSALQSYRGHWKTLLASSLVTVLVHLSFAVSLYFVARGLFAFAPSLTEHLVLYPVANTGSIIPLSAGPLEYFLDTLYPLFTIPGHEPYRDGFGMMVGLIFRFVGILSTGIGMVYYLSSRSEIAGALKDMSENKAR